MRAYAPLALAAILTLAPAALRAEKAGDKKWSEHAGKVEFILGYEEGMAEAKATGRPVMVYVTTTW